MDSEEQKDHKIAEYYLKISSDFTSCSKKALEAAAYFNQEARKIIDKWNPKDETKQKEDL